MPRSAPRPNLPDPLPWNERDSVLGSIKGDRSSMMEDLIRLLELAREGAHKDAEVNWPDARSTITVGSAIGPIANCGLFRRAGQQFDLSADGRTWLVSRDPESLIAILHAHVRFIGEILEELSVRSMSHPALLGIARDKYGFGWTTSGQIHNRTKWLEAAGLVDSFSHKVHINDNGRTFLARLRVVKPSVDVVSPSDLRPPPEVIASLIKRLDKHPETRSRAASCYIPAIKSNDGQLEVIKTIVESCSSATRDHTLIAKAAAIFRTSNTSAEKFVRTLILLGLAERVSSSEIAATPAGMAWVETSYPIDLARIVHANVWYFAEIIRELEFAGKLTFGQILAECAKYSTSDRYEPLKRGGLTARIGLLQATGLISYISNHCYKATSLGGVFRLSVPCIDPPGAFPEDPAQTMAGSAERGQNGHQESEDRIDRVARLSDSKVDSQRRKNVFVVYGRNNDARLAIFDFLRSIGLNPIEWTRARAMTGEGSPYIGTILDTAFNAAQAVVVLFTPDEVVSLRPEYADGIADPELSPVTQARPNVLFEAGMAIGRDAARTILVELGRTRGLSDITGRYVVQIGNAPDRRQELAERLRDAGCEVDTSGVDWYESGRFEIPQDPDFAVATTAKGTSSAPAGVVEDDWTRSGSFLLRIHEPKDAGFGLYTVLGEARNEGPTVRMASITAVFSDKVGRIVGSATGAVSQIQRGELKTFTLNSTDDLSVYVGSRVQVDSAT